MKIKKKSSEFGWWNPKF